MHFMNTYAINDAANRYSGHPVLRKATKTLAAFRDLIDVNSDGWAYWRAPVKAADKLMTLIEHPETATDEGLKKALTPIKSFCTRHGLVYSES